MKRIVFTAIFLLSSIAMIAQNQESLLRNLESRDSTKVDATYVLDDNNNSIKPIVVTVTEKVTVVGNDTIKETSTDTATVNKVDTSVIRFGRKKIVVIDSKDKTTIEIPEKEKDEEFIYDFKEKKHFKGHWSGFEMGINGFMDKNYSMTMKNDLAWLDLKQGRSWNVNLNFMQYSIGFGTDKVGLVTGMGLEFNDYHFSNPISLKVENGVTVVDSSYITAGYKVDKTKLSTTNLTLPLLLEFQIPTGEKRHRIYISAGVIGGLRIGSHTKVVYDDGDRRKDKSRSDFNIATLRYGLTTRIGYRGIRLYANYYPVPLFEKDKGPEIYPFSLGLVLIPFRD